MKRSFKVRIGLAAAGIGVVAVAALPASASVGAATLVGNGSYSPGLTVNGGVQSFTMAATGVVATDSAQGTMSCLWSGNDTIGSYAQGAGSFNGTCSTAGGTSSVSGTYLRTGVVVTISGTWVGVVNGGMGAVCHQTPTSISVPPIPPAIQPFTVWCAIWW